MKSAGIDLLLKAFDVSFDRRTLSLAIVGLVIASVAGKIFFRLADAIDNVVVTVLFTLIALVAMWVIITFFVGAISKMCYERLAGRPSPTMGEAMSYAAAHIHSFLLAPLFLWIVIFIIYFIEAIVLLFGRIPAIGPPLIALLFLPLVLLNLFLLLLIFFGAWLVPAVIAAEGTGPLHTLSRLEKITRRAPGRVIAYLGSTVFLVLFLGFVLALLVFFATFQTGAFALAMTGGKAAPGMFASSTRSLGSLWTGPLGPSLRHSGIGSMGGQGGGLTGLIYSLVWLILGTIVVAVPYFIFPLSSACATYISVTEEDRTTTTPPPVFAAPPATPPAPQHCGQCGAELPPGADFCGECGAQIA